jgi:hypothetical protein
MHESKYIKSLVLVENGSQKQVCRVGIRIGRAILLSAALFFCFWLLASVGVFSQPNKHKIRACTMEGTKDGLAFFKVSDLRI